MPLNPPLTGGLIVAIAVVPVRITRSVCGAIVAADAIVVSLNFDTIPSNI
jgi:hypothetical protein